jgi:hypothetical protein
MKRKSIGKGEIEMTATNIELTETELAGYVGRPYSCLPANVTIAGAWPIVDRSTMLITGIVFGDNTEGYETADLVNNEIVTGEHYVAFVVAVSE